MKKYTCMGCKNKFPRKEIHSSLYCRKCLNRIRLMYKDINITVWKPDKISKLYQRWSWHKIIEAGEVSTEFTAGWYYKLGKTEFGVYNSKRDAEASMLLRLKDYSWQE